MTSTKGINGYKMNYRFELNNIAYMHAELIQKLINELEEKDKFIVQIGSSLFKANELISQRDKKIEELEKNISERECKINAHLVSVEILKDLHNESTEKIEEQKKIIKHQKKKIDMCRQTIEEWKQLYDKREDIIDEKYEDRNENLCNCMFGPQIKPLSEYIFEETKNMSDEEIQYIIDYLNGCIEECEFDILKSGDEVYAEYLEYLDDLRNEKRAFTEILNDRRILTLIKMVPKQCTNKIEKEAEIEELKDLHDEKESDYDVVFFNDKPIIRSISKNGITVKCHHGQNLIQKKESIEKNIKSIETELNTKDSSYESFNYRYKKLDGDKDAIRILTPLKSSTAKQKFNKWKKETEEKLSELKKELEILTGYIESTNKIIEEPKIKKTEKIEIKNTTKPKGIVSERIILDIDDDENFVLPDDL